MTATTPLGRLRPALREAREQEARLFAYTSCSPELGYLRSVVYELTTALALAEASLNAAQPALDSHTIVIDDSRRVKTCDAATEAIAYSDAIRNLPSALWLDLGEGETK